MHTETQIKYRADTDADRAAAAVRMVSPISIPDDNDRQATADKRRLGGTASSYTQSRMENDSGTALRSPSDFGRSSAMIGSPPSSSILSLLSGNGSFKNAAMAGISSSSKGDARPGRSASLSNSVSPPSAASDNTVAPVRITGFNAGNGDRQNPSHSPSASSSTSSDFATEAATPPPFAADLHGNARSENIKQTSALPTQLAHHHDEHDEMHDIFDDFSTPHGAIYSQLSPLSRSFSAAASTTAGSDGRRMSWSAGRGPQGEDDGNDAGQRSGILGWLNGSNVTNKGGATAAAGHKMSQSVGSSHGFPIHQGQASDNNPLGLFRRLSMSGTRKVRLCLARVIKIVGDIVYRRSHR